MSFGNLNQFSVVSNFSHRLDETGSSVPLYIRDGMTNENRYRLHQPKDETADDPAS